VRLQITKESSEKAALTEKGEDESESDVLLVLLLRGRRRGTRDDEGEGEGGAFGEQGPRLSIFGPL